jgi:membrane fusion protein, hemolysin D
MPSKDNHNTGSMAASSGRRMESHARSEREFLPAALEIQETPPSPLGRAVLWVILGFCVTAVAWASLGEVDIVAVAPGKLVPSDRVKVIQAANLGTVSAIHVSDGEHVTAGQQLIALDATLTDADRQRIREELGNAEVELARYQAFAGWLRDGASTSLEVPVTVLVSDGYPELQRSLLAQAIEEHRGRLAVIDQSLIRRRAELDATEQQLNKLERTLPLITERVRSVAKLAESKLVPRDTYLELEAERIETEQDLAAQEATRRSLVAAIGELEAQRSSAGSEARREALAQAEDLEKRIAALRQEQIKAEQLSTQQLLTAPVAGKVQQLVVHTIGGVVRPGDPLLVIVPADAPVEIEARVLNKDIGFVREGQMATVKLDAFPFTRYGALDGEVMSVSDDAIQDEHLGLVYPARVRLAASTVHIDDKIVTLSPGMAASVEIATGRRTVSEFLLSPIAQTASESLHER